MILLRFFFAFTSFLLLPYEAYSSYKTIESFSINLLLQFQETVSKSFYTAAK